MVFLFEQSARKEQSRVLGTGRACPDKVGRFNSPRRTFAGSKIISLGRFLTRQGFFYPRNFQLKYTNLEQLPKKLDFFVQNLTAYSSKIAV
jgi:hypothetical protein